MEIMISQIIDRNNITFQRHNIPLDSIHPQFNLTVHQPMIRDIKMWINCKFLGREMREYRKVQ